MNQETLHICQQLSILMQHSNNVTKSALDSIASLEHGINEAYVKVEDIFDVIEMRKKTLSRIELTMQELDGFYALVDTIDNDRLRVMDGPQGSFTEFIAKLNHLKSIEKYVDWSQERENGNKTKSLQSNHLNKVSMTRFNYLLYQGEKILVQEFQNVVKHYSTIDSMKHFIEYLLNDFDVKDENEKEEEEEEEDEIFKPNFEQFNQRRESCNFKLHMNVNYENSLYISDETLDKLEELCWWFLEREQKYELYDEKNQHCDIEQKLKFCETRNEFLKICLQTYSKMSSLGFKKGAKFSHTLGKLFNAATSQVLHSYQTMTNISETGTQSNGLASTLTNKLNTLQRRTTSLINRRPDSIADLEPPSDEPKLLSKTKIISEDYPNFETSKKWSKPVECIELFADNLDFCLKLLKHENIILNRIFRRSDETKIDSISRLTILVIDQIQTRLENFFTDVCDFTKLVNNGDRVVCATVHLILKVRHLKDKASAWQTEDLSSPAKLLGFSMRLNEIAAQIFAIYLEAVRVGYLNQHPVPLNSGIHEYSIKTCQVLTLIRQHERALFEPIKIAYDSHAAKLKSKKQLRQETESLAESDELKRYQNSRSRGRLVQTEQAESFEQFEYSQKWYFAKYYSTLIENLNHFLSDEASKISQTNSTSATFKNHLKSLKSSVFLLNNAEYVNNVVKELNIENSLKRLTPDYEANLDSGVGNHLDKASELFKYLNQKWLKLNSVDLAETGNFVGSNLRLVSSSSMSNLEQSEQKINSDQRLSINTFRRTYLASKKKKREEFLLQLKETLFVCTKLIIEKFSLNEAMRNLFGESLKLILATLESLGELKEMAPFLNIKLSLDESLTNKILFEIFPNSQL